MSCLTVFSGFENSVGVPSASQRSREAITHYLDWARASTGLVGVVTTVL